MEVQLIYYGNVIVTIFVSLAVVSSKVDEVTVKVYFVVRVQIVLIFLKVLLVPAITTGTTVAEPVCIRSNRCY